jgi:hypothetical protein
MSRFLKPEVVRINLTGGDYIVIKRQLTAGEKRRVFARTTKPVKAGQLIEIDLEKAGISEMVEYLVDWSFTDTDGKPVPIKDMPAEYVVDVLNSLDADSFQEITDAISAHEKSIDEEKKTIRSTANA